MWTSSGTIKRRDIILVLRYGCQRTSEMVSGNKPRLGKATMKLDELQNLCPDPGVPGYSIVILAPAANILYLVQKPSPLASPIKKWDRQV